MTAAPYLDEFEAFSANGGASPDWLAPVRKRAFGRFAEVGFPTSKDEEWRFTSVTPIASRQFSAPPAATVTAAELEPFIFGHPEWPRLVFVNGRYDAGLSHLPQLAAGVRVGSLDQALREDPSLAAHLARHAPVEQSAFTGACRARWASSDGSSRSAWSSEPTRTPEASSGRCERPAS